MATIETKKGTMDFDEFLRLEQRDPIYAALISRDLLSQREILTFEDQEAIANGKDWIEKALLAERAEHEVCASVQHRLVDTGDYRILIPLASHTSNKDVWKRCMGHCANVRDAGAANKYFGSRRTA